MSARVANMLVVAVAVLLAACTPAPRPAQPGTTPPDPWASAARRDAGTSLTDASFAAAIRDATPDSGPPIAAPVVVTVTSSVVCPARTNQTGLGLDTTPLDVWRSRVELPACLAPHIPADVDFTREMIAADLPARVAQLEILTAAPPVREGRHLVIEQQAPFVPCPLCRGAVDNLYPPVRPEPRPTRVWRIPRLTGVHVFFRLRPHPQQHQHPCPPCTAP